MIDEEVPCLASKHSPNSDAAQPEHRETVMDAWGSIEVENQTEHPDPSTVLDTDEEPVVPDPFTRDCFFQDQRENEISPKRSRSTGDAQSCVDYDRYGILVRRAKLNGAPQTVVPEGLCHQLLHLIYYPVVAGHPGETWTYHTLKREYYWSQMASDEFSTVRNCIDCIRLRGTHLKH